jgi:hypothetical protein
MKAWIFIQKLVALSKPNVNEVFIKNRTFLIKDGFLIKGWVRLINEWRKGEMAQEGHETFL